MSILLEVYLSSLVLNLEEEGSSAIMKQDLVSGCPVYKVLRNHVHLCVESVHVCVCVCVHLSVHYISVSVGDPPGRCREVDRNWEYQVNKEHRPLYKTPSDMFEPELLIFSCNCVPTPVCTLRSNFSCLFSFCLPEVSQDLTMEP